MSTSIRSAVVLLDHDARAAPTADSAHELTVALATALHRCGTASHDLEDHMREVVDALGIEARFFATPTALFVQLGHGPGSETRLIRVDPPATELARARRVADVARALVDGTIDPLAALERLREIESAAPAYGPVPVALAFGAAAAGAAHLFGGVLSEVLASAGIGGVVGGLTVVAPRLRQQVNRLFEPVAAFVAAALAILTCALLPGADALRVTLAALIVLLPGLSLTQAMSELAVRNLASGTARFMGAVSVLLMIGFGVALGRGVAEPLAAPLAAQLAHWTGPWASQAAMVPSPPGGASLALDLTIQLGALAVVAAALVVLLAADARDLPLVLVAVAIALWTQRLGALGLGPQLGASVAAFALGSFANTVGRWRRQPPATLLIPGLIVLVPGSLGMRSLDAMLTHDLVGGLESAFGTMLVGVSLVAGLLVANAAVPVGRFQTPRGERKSCVSKH